MLKEIVTIIESVKSVINFGASITKKIKKDSNESDTAKEICEKNDEKTKQNLNNLLNN